MTDLERFNNYFSKNYKELSDLSKHIARQDLELADELLHITYLNVRKSIEKNGFEGDNFRNYISRSMSNLNHMIYNKNKTIFIGDMISDNLDIDNAEFVSTIDNIFIQQSLDELNEKEEVEMFKQFKQEIYDFVDANYNMIEATFFKYRYKNGYTYQKCADKSSNFNYNYSKAKIFQIIKKINKDLLVFKRSGPGKMKILLFIKELNKINLAEANEIVQKIKI